MDKLELLQAENQTYSAVTLLKEDSVFFQCLKMSIIYLKEPEHKTYNEFYVGT